MMNNHLIFSSTTNKQKASHPYCRMFYKTLNVLFYLDENFALFSTAKLEAPGITTKFLHKKPSAV